jgi:hypothetical protein
MYNENGKEEWHMLKRAGMWRKIHFVILRNWELVSSLEINLYDKVTSGRFSLNTS